MKPNIAYYMNKLLDEGKYCTINTAVEASTLADRHHELLNQDISEYYIR